MENSITVIYHRLVTEKAVAVLLESRHDAMLYFADSQDRESCFDGIDLQSSIPGELVITGTYASPAYLAAFVMKHAEGTLRVTVLAHSADVVDTYTESYKDVPNCTVVELGAYVAAQDPPELITHLTKFHREPDTELIYRGFLFKHVGAGDMFRALRANLETADVDTLREAGQQIVAVNNYNAEVLVAHKAIKVTVGGLDARLVCASDVSVMPPTNEAAKETGVGVSFRYDTSIEKTRITVVVDTERVDSAALFEAWKATKCGGGRLDAMGATLNGYVTPPAAGSELLDVFPALE